MIDVINLQRKIKLETDLYRTYVTELSSSVEEANGKTFSVAFVSDKRMIELNKFFRGKDSTTDVLSFAHEPEEFVRSTLFSAPVEEQAEFCTLNKGFLGDIVISVEQAECQAKENELSLENEIKQLILHGLLHLCGYDHESDKGEMNRRELELRKQLKI
jgi:probable rRNA maturation factor